MGNYKNVMIRVWGERALFQRFEIQDDLYSYDMITPSAARGILENIYWHPGLSWKIDNIYVVNPIKFSNGILKNVEYIIEAHFEMNENANEVDNPGKFKDMFLRRLKRKQPYKPVFFGRKEYPAEFELYNGSPESINSHYKNGIKDLGIMIYDYDYSKELVVTCFFRATLRYGVLRVNDPNIKLYS